MQPKSSATSTDLHLVQAPLPAIVNPKHPLIRLGQAINWTQIDQAVEPCIGHIKHNDRMARNYLKGTPGDKINSLRSAAIDCTFRKLLTGILLRLDWVQLRHTSTLGWPTAICHVAWPRPSHTMVAEK